MKTDKQPTEAEIMYRKIERIIEMYHPLDKPSRRERYWQTRRLRAILKGESDGQ